jgi:hypothetical protein
MNPHRYIIYDTSSIVPEIEQFLSHGGNVYIEGGDVWYYDPTLGGFDFSPHFCIDAIWNSIGPCPGVLGVSGTFSENMDFSYAGESASIDRIDPTGNGHLIFTNTFNGYGCGVATNNSRVGLSFELGGLVDTVAPSTRMVLLDSIMCYFGVPPTGFAKSSVHKLAATIALSCHPNPFLQIADIRYQIPDEVYQNIRGSVGGISDYQKPELKIYDITGRLVKSFATSDLLSSNLVRWDGTDQVGRDLPHGVYFVHLQAAGLSRIAKTVLLQ